MKISWNKYNSQVKIPDLCEFTCKALSTDVQKLLNRVHHH